MYFLTPLVAVLLFLCGYVVWRLQLVAKRRFEVAEQALTAFQKAADNLSIVRDRLLRGTELAAVEVPQNVTKEQEERLRMYNTYIARAQAGDAAFAELRTAQILARLHLGQDAAAAMDTLFGARWEVIDAARALYLDPPFHGEGGDPQALIQHRDFLVSMRCIIAEHRNKNGIPAETDELSNGIDAARSKLKQACQPFLSHPPWLKALSDYLRHWHLGELRLGSLPIFAFTFHVMQTE